jgi:hypothetical protein
MVVHHVIAVGHIAVTPVAHGCSAGRHDAIVEFWWYKGILSSLCHVLFRSRMHSPTMFVVVQSKYRNKSAGDDELVITSRSTSSFPSTRSLLTTKHPTSLTSASVHNRWYGYSHLGIPFSFQRSCLFEEHVVLVFDPVNSHRMSMLNHSSNLYLLDTFIHTTCFVLPIKCTCKESFSSNFFLRWMLATRKY